MLESWFPSEYLLVGLLGLGSLVAGLVALGAGRRRSVLGSFALTLLAGLATFAAANQDDSVALPLWLLAGAYGGLAVLRSADQRSFLGRVLALLGRPRVQWAVVLAVCPALVLWWVWRVDSATDNPVDELSSPFELARPPLRQAAQAHTDRGRPLPLFTPTDGAASTEDLAAQAPQYLRDLGLSFKLVQMSKADVGSNCHGWLFAAGRYWIHGDQVEHILGDNGYSPVTKPRAGDVAIYHDQNGHIVHSGVVRSVWEDDQVLIESKWGLLGRYLHTSEAQSYGTDYTYYRSRRLGHRLLGLEGETPPAPAEHSLFQWDETRQNSDRETRQRGE